jgi:hypothetical protein
MPKVLLLSPNSCVSCESNIPLSILRVKEIDISIPLSSIDQIPPKPKSHLALPKQKSHSHTIKNMADQSTPTYTGPSMGTLMAQHTLGDAIIEYHPKTPAILGSNELALLRAYVMNPSAAPELLKTCDMVDSEEEQPGERARVQYGSLVGYAIAGGKLDEREIGVLREWFEKGGAGDLDGVDMTGPATRPGK